VVPESAAAERGIATPLQYYNSTTVITPIAGSRNGFAVENRDAEFWRTVRRQNAHLLALPATPATPFSQAARHLQALLLM
jgi:hypothetical protein